MPVESNFTIRLSRAAKEFNVSVMTIRKFFAMKGFQVDTSPNTKLTAEMYALLMKEFQGEKDMKNEAKRLGNISYRGGGASIESNSYTSAVANPEVIKEIEKRRKQKEKERKLKKEKRFAKQKERRKEKKENENKTIKLEREDTFKTKRKKKLPKVEYEVLLSKIEFNQGIASIIYGKRPYVCSNYDKILEQVCSRLSKAEGHSIQVPLIKVEIDIESGRFIFNDIWRQTKNDETKDSFLPENKRIPPKKETQTKNKDVSRIQSSTIKTITLGTGNIRFYNGYYLIFQTNKGEIDNTVTPYRVNDPNSHEILNLVHKYFEQIFEQKRIIVKIDETKIIEPSRLDLFQLSNYVRELQRNLDEKKGVWWEEVQNARKRSFVQCFGEPTESVKKRMAKSKNEFLYNLSSLQNEKKLIHVYEINHGKEEDAFIFTISMSNNRSAIVFENASKDASTTTWIFVAKDEDYEPCINLVFDYFTDYTVVKKRSSLREKTVTVNPPEKFKAESYAFIYHDDIGRWLKKLNKILGQTPESSEIQFVPGLHIPQSSETRTGHDEAITIRNLHNELKRKLYDRLCGESGKDNVGTEIRVGSKRIDTVVKGKEFFDIYEIKTATNPFDCVTEALGQLCQYAYLYCPDKIGKLVIVGPSETTKEVEQYLSTLRKNHSLQLYYMKV